MRVAQVGNFEPPHSTENELRKALVDNGCKVSPFQEGRIDAWEDLLKTIDSFDFLVWTRTASELEKIPVSLQERVMRKAEKAGVPTVGYHLDIWWDLPRQREMRSVPYFRLVDYFCSADGGHEEQFKAAGINHVWFSPGVSAAECGIGKESSKFRAKIGFVGCWDGSYHKEWKHRFQLVDHLKAKGARFWPEPGHHAVRGPELRDLYASVDVLVGDSCLVGPNGRYWSDRIPETLGRGGVLIHPRVQGMEEHYTPGEHLEVWDVGDWDRLDALIDELLNDPARRDNLRSNGMRHVVENHTYTVRMGQLIDMLKKDGAL